MMKSSIKLLHVLGLAVLAFSVPVLACEEHARAASSDFNSIIFTDEMWGADILENNKTLAPKYVSKDHVFTIAPPPANDSDVTKQELETLHKYERERRTPDQVALIKEEIGTWKDLKIDPSVPVSPDVREKTQKLLSEASLEYLYFAMQFKRQFKRARPTQLDQDLTTVIDVPGHPAYPSAHGGQTRIVALALGYIDPAHKGQYMQNANDIGVRREIAGVHYPSDTRAGIEVGEQVFAEMMKSPEFKAQIDELAAAVRTANGNKN